MRPFVSCAHRSWTSWNRFTSREFYPKSHLSFFSSSSSPLQDTPSTKKKRLDIAIVGAPNAGKSQLLNVLVQSPVAAVSKKRHTTRSGILGARTIGTTQLLFIDTPGFLKLESAKQEGLFKELIRNTSKELDRADFTLVVVDAVRKLDESIKEALVYLMLRAHHSTGRDENPFVHSSFTSNDSPTLFTDGLDHHEPSTPPVREKFAIVLNKVDLVHPKERLLDLATELGELGEACVRFRWDLDEKVFMDDSCANTPTNSDKYHSNEDRKISYRDASAVMTSREETDSLDGSTVGNENNPLSTSHLSEDEIAELEAQYPPIFYISALQNDGVDDILKYLMDLATPCDEWEIPQQSDDSHDINGMHSSSSSSLDGQEPQVTTMSNTERVQEIIREKLFRCLHQEVPHSISQVNRVFQQFRRKEDGAIIVRIDQDLIVKTKSHYNLVMGRGGSTLQRIQSSAKRDLMKVFPKGCVDVVLNLHVKLSKTKSSQNDHRALESERQGIVQKNL